MTKTFYIVPHTHWDREWYQPFQVFRSRLVEIVDDLLEIIENDARFAHFLLDGHTAAALDYLEIRPENKTRLTDAVSQGRISTGPFHILMDEFLVSGETIVRNLRRGIDTAEELGSCSRIAYLPDMFGHISQMPQILARAGISDAVVWRGVPFAIDRTLFKWVAPDGTSVRTAYMATSYSNGAYLPSDPRDLKARLEHLASELDAFSADGKYLIMNGTDHSPPQPELSEAVEKVAELFGESARVKICSLADYFEDLPTEPEQAWQGEFRSGARVNLLMGVVSNRVDIRRLTAETEDLLTRYAEPLAALYAPRLSRRYFDVAWDFLIQNSAHDSICACSIDDVTDQVWSRLLQAHQIAKGSVLSGMEALSKEAEAKTQKNDSSEKDSSDTEKTRSENLDRSSGGTYSYPGVVLFNPSVTPREGPAEIEVPLYGEGDQIFLVDDENNLRPAQILEESAPEVLIEQTLAPEVIRAYLMAVSSREVMGYYINDVIIDDSAQTPSVVILVETVPIGDLDIDQAKQRILDFLDHTEAKQIKITARRSSEARLLVSVPEVPPLGWAAFPVVGKAAVSSSPESEIEVDGDYRMENAYLSFELEESGTYRLTHKESGLTFDGLGRLVDSGEWGDTYNYSPPPEDAVISDPVDCEVSLAYKGPLAAAFRVVRRYSIPSHVDAVSGRRSADSPRSLVISELLELWAGEPYLRVTTEFTNESKDHRLRMHFPLPFAPQGSYGAGAYDVVARGLKAEGGPHEVGLPTFPARGFVDVWGFLDGNDKAPAGLAVLSGPVTEYEVVDSELAVTLLRATGMLSRPDAKLRPAAAGPSIPTEASQCIGPHRWKIAVMPHTGNWDQAGVADAAEKFVFPLIAKETAALRSAQKGARINIESRGCFASAVVPDADRPLLRVWAIRGGGFISCSVPAEEVAITGHPIEGQKAARYEPFERIELGDYEIKSLRLSI